MFCIFHRFLFFLIKYTVYDKPLCPPWLLLHVGVFPYLYFLAPISYADLVHITDCWCERHSWIWTYLIQKSFCTSIKITTLCPHPISQFRPIFIGSYIHSLYQTRVFYISKKFKRETFRLFRLCFHIYRNVSDCYRRKHTRYSVYKVNVMLRERFGLGHRSSPAPVITQISCLSDDR